MKRKNKISRLNSMLLIMGGLLVLSVNLLPIWKIELDAAQYPEGLELQIFSYKLDGQVDIINGLNHYIGMKTLHQDDFVEFKVLPYIIAVFGMAFILVGLKRQPRWVHILFVAFLLFGILAMVDFWLWEYDYGHNLSSDAPIKVPGMAYQPPLIGYKKLLNFGAYSIPDIGGWLFITSGLMLGFCSYSEIRKHFKKHNT